MGFFFYFILIIFFAFCSLVSQVVRIWRMRNGESRGEETRGGRQEEGALLAAQRQRLS